jgi:hypothetical protein
MNAREFEVRCANCDAGFAVGTRHCIHCGQRLGAGVLPGLQRRNPADPADPAEADDAQAEEATPAGVWARIAPGFLTLLFIAIGVLGRACAGEGH